MDPQQTKAAQRRGKGPPQVQFLTATHPSEFKTAENKKTVRSGAMKHYRNQIKDRGKKKNRRSEDEPETSSTVVAGRAGKAPATPRSEGHDQASPPTGYAAYQPTSPRAWAGWRQEILNPEASAALIPHMPRYQHAISSTPCAVAVARVTDYEEDDSHEQEMMQMLVRDLRIMSIGDGVDSFRVFPQFRSAELNSMNLVRECKH